MTAMKSRCSSSALLYIMLMISFIWIRPCFWAVAQGVAGPTEDGRLGWAYTSSDQIWIWYRLTVFQWIIYGTTIDFQKLEKGQYPKEVIISWHTVTYKNFFPHSVALSILQYISDIDTHYYVSVLATTLENTVYISIYHMRLLHNFSQNASNHVFIIRSLP